MWRTYPDVEVEVFVVGEEVLEEPLQLDAIQIPLRDVLGDLVLVAHGPSVWPTRLRAHINSTLLVRFRFSLCGFSERASRRQAALQCKFVYPLPYIST